MQDIAAELGLSIATVSRALRRVPGINAETRARVLRTASELGYQLPQTYRNAPLERAQLHHIGVFIETSQTHLPPAYLTGLSDASMNLNASLVVHYVKPGECEALLDPKNQPRAMSSGLLSGAVLIFWWPTEVVQDLSKHLPLVSIMHRYPGTDVDMIGIDNEGGIGLLVRHLHEQGHRKIGFVGRCAQLHWANVRFGGYVAALSALDLEYSRERVLDVSFDTLNNYEGSWAKVLPRAERLTREGVTAWICASEPGGWQLHQFLTGKKLRVPEDVSVTGFHRPNFRDPARPDLASVSASYEAIGSAALRRLLYRIQNPLETSRMILFPCDLYAGRTVARVPVRTTAEKPSL